MTMSETFVREINVVIGEGLPERTVLHLPGFPSVLLMYDFPEDGWNIIRELDPRVDPDKIFLLRNQVVVLANDEGARDLIESGRLIRPMAGSSHP